MGDRHLVVGVQRERAEDGIYAQRWTAALGRAGATVRALDLEANNALEQIRGCDAIMWRYIHVPGDKLLARGVLRSAELVLGITVFPDVRTSWHFDDKVAQHYALDGLGAPRPATWLFWRKRDALDFVAQADYPLVWKLRTGAGSANVTMLRTPEQARAAVDEVFDQGVLPGSWIPTSGTLRKRARGLARRAEEGITYATSGRYPRLPTTYWEPEKGFLYLQEFVPGNDYDIRVTVIGRRAFAYRRFNRPGDFRASGSGHFDTDPHAIDRHCVDLAFELSEAGRFQSMAYDFLLDSRTRRPLVVEMSYGFVDWMVQSCPGHWTTSGTWIPGQMWPQDAQVEDLLTDLGHPGPSS